MCSWNDSNIYLEPYITCTVHLKNIHMVTSQIVIAWNTVVVHRLGFYVLKVTNKYCVWMCVFVYKHYSHLLLLPLGKEWVSISLVRFLHRWGSVLSNPDLLWRTIKEQQKPSMGEVWACCTKQSIFGFVRWLSSCTAKPGFCYSNYCIMCIAASSIVAPWQPCFFKNKAS